MAAAGHWGAAVTAGRDESPELVLVMNTQQVSFGFLILNNFGS